MITRILNGERREMLVVLTLSSLLALSSVASAQTASRLPVQPTGNLGGPRAVGGPLQKMKRALALTNEQVKQLDPIMKDQQAKVAAVRSNTTLSHQDKMARLNQIWAATDLQVKSVLTPEQARKWDKMTPAQHPTKSQP
jgi:Spy/CpxP family protein refolding chaperone